MNDREKSLARVAVDLLGLLAQSLGIADQRRQRSPQLVAGIGDEIDAHLLGRARLAAVDEADQVGAAGKRRDSHQPVPARSAQARQLDRFGAPSRPLERLERGGVGDHLVERRAVDRVAEQCAGRGVGDDDSAAGGDQRRFLESFEQRRDVFANQHRAAD